MNEVLRINQLANQAKKYESLTVTLAVDDVLSAMEQLTATTNSLTNAQEALKSAGIEADTVQAGVMELVSKLVEMEKQEPVACKKRLVNHRSGVEHSWTYHGKVDKDSRGDVFRVEVVPLFARPAPAIDLNAVRAEGVEMFIGELSELFRSLKPGGKPWQAVKGIVIRATSFAAQLRAGNAGKDGV